MGKGLEGLAETLGKRGQRYEPLAPYTTMRVGGPADLLVVCRTVEEVVEAVGMARAHDVPFLVLGDGSNVLVADAGVRGLVVVNRADRVRIEEDGTVWAEAGASMAALARETTRRGWAGLEWAAGLPGTVGGAVVGNAGAFGRDVGSVLRSATVLEPDGVVRERPAEWFAFGYRTSRLKGAGKGEQGGRRVVLAATFELQRGDPDVLRARVAEVLRERRARQPGGATMGSTFKNPPGDYAGRLIEAAGLKGHRIGGAVVSKQHANFILNVGDATAAEVWALIQYVRAEVERQFGVRLELEIERVGEWG
ncbi:MAG TPA: UDP-N-acetylmuramate dehydrogenase [Anaerolineales bacterium]|nr:UDP-N-acetylmuramate dehydrogenase [Anaerolineales bacterium]